MTATISRDAYGNRPGFGLHVPTTNPCPAWCTDRHGHGYDSEDDDGNPTRYHDAFADSFTTADLNEYDNPKELGISVHVKEAVSLATRRAASWAPATLWLVADGVTSLTATEARRLSVGLAGAADHLERVTEDVFEPRAAGPAPADVEALTALLDLMANFSDNEQRARYLLSSNWVRDRGVAAAARLTNGGAA